MYTLSVMTRYILAIALIHLTIMLGSGATFLALIILLFQLFIDRYSLITVFAITMIFDSVIQENLPNTELSRITSTIYVITFVTILVFYISLCIGNRNATK